MEEMLSNNATPVNMFFSANGSAQGKTASDKSSEAYIILQNDVLHEKYDTMVKELNEISSEKEDLETDNDRLQKSRICLQGYVKNEYSRAIEYKKQNKIFRRAHKILCQYSKVSNGMSILYGFVPMVFRSMYVSGGIMSLIFVLHVFMIRNYEARLRTVVDRKLLLKSQNEIDTIEKSSKMIEDLVDNM